jgi:predicted ArsR family transcriptional regulator
MTVNEAPRTAGALGADPTGDGDFSAAVAALSSTFGDPSRRSIYLYLRANPHSSVAELAKAIELHPNVVRHHLDRLVASGHVTVEAPTKTAGAGRPAKRFSAITEDLSLDTSSRRDDLLVALLERSLELLGPEQAETMAAEVGEAYGRTLASRMEPGEGTRSVEAAMSSIARTLSAHGFAARAELDRGGHSIVSDHCPFGDAAAHYPVLCAVDRGMVTGLLQGMGVTNGASKVQLSSRARGDDDCRATA